MGKKLTKEDFIVRAVKVHGDKYDYSLVEYVNNRTKVNILCPKHGVFVQKPDNHTQGDGCKHCRKDLLSDKFRTPFEDVLKRANEIHGDRYKYELVGEYKNGSSKLRITCNKHGEFIQSVYVHTSRMCGCPKCGYELGSDKRKLASDEALAKAKEVHGDIYTYPNFHELYDKITDKYEIVCKEHGSFFQSFNNHTSQGQGCPKCGYESNGEKGRYTIEELVEQARAVHGDRYNYDKVTSYNNIHEKVCIVCPEHGSFLQPFHSHIKHSQGCPACSATGFKYSEEGKIYLMKLRDGFKVGISNKHPSIRAKRILLNGEVDVISYFVGNGNLCQDLESELLKKFAGMFENMDAVHFRSGHTESFVCEEFNIPFVLDYFDKFCNSRGLVKGEVWNKKINQ